MTGEPSEAAVAAAADLLDRSGLTHPQTGPAAATVASELLAKAHDPMLGLDRSVRLGDVVEALVRFEREGGGIGEDSMDYIAREFGGVEGQA